VSAVGVGKIECLILKELPRVLDRQTEVILDCELHSCLNVTNRTSIDADDRDASLLARCTQRGIYVACTDGAVVEYVALEVRILLRPGLVSAPVAIELIDLDICTISRWAGHRVAC
jgi:hypothetical protein